MTESTSTNFLAAFNAIENHFRSRLNDRTSSFRQLAETYANKYNLRRQELDSLRTYAELRNFIAHNEYYGGRPIAEPTPDVVAAIQSLYTRIVKPPTVLNVLPHRSVCKFSPEDTVSKVLDAVRKHNYSQFPIYEENVYFGLLTTNCIARWLAERLLTDELAESEPVKVVLRFNEPHERAVHCPRSINVRQAIQQLSTTSGGVIPPAAVIITDGGKFDQAPLAIVVAEDLSVLFQALG